MRLPIPLIRNILCKSSVDIRRDFRLYGKLHTDAFKIYYDTIPKITYDSIRGRNHRSTLEIPINDITYMTYIVFGRTVDIFSRTVEICRRFGVCTDLPGDTGRYREAFFFEW